MEEIEKLEGELKTRTEHIEAERAIVEKDRSGVEAETSSANEIVEARTAERERIESELPGSLRSQVQALERTRKGIFLSRAENGTCQSCFVRVRPQVFQEIKAASKVHTCSSCRRFLYFEPSLRSEPTGATETNGVEAVNGGGVV
jgi:predicted  nucleic acid-binding Zn-ribbon protein